MYKQEIFNMSDTVEQYRHVLTDSIPRLLSTPIYRKLLGEKLPEQRKFIKV